MDKNIERISQNIKSCMPGSEICIIQSERDHVGPLLSVRGKSHAGLDKLARSLDHIIVEIDASEDFHILVIPLAPESASRRL